MEIREILLIAHTGRASVLESAEKVALAAAKSGIKIRVLADESGELSEKCYTSTVPADEFAAVGTDLVLVLGGDGTFLRAAEVARPAGVPVFGFNHGHVGFLAEAESDALEETLELLMTGRFMVEERMTIDVTAHYDGGIVASTWALNEASIEKNLRERILDILVEVDNRPVSAFGCDGILASTPTGSTAYAFSAGGPIIWPDVQALLVIPSNAHAVFQRPLVVSPTSTVTFHIDKQGQSAVLCCDGRRLFDLPAGTQVDIVQGALPVKMIKLLEGPFTDRLATKLQLPVKGWRNQNSGRIK
jgi:NAD+ kinase